MLLEAESSVQGDFKVFDFDGIFLASSLSMCSSSFSIQHHPSATLRLLYFLGESST